LQVVNAVVKLLPTLIPVLIKAAITLFMALVEALPQILGALIEGAIALIEAVVDMLPTLIPVLLDAAITLFMALVEALPQILEALLPAIGGLIMSVAEMLPTLITTLLEAAVTLFMAIVDAVPEVLDGLGTALGELIQGGIDAISGWVKDMAAAGQDLVKGIVNGIGDGIEWVKNKIKEVCVGAVDALKSFFGIKSPSRLMAQYGRFISQGLANGIKAGGSGVVAAVKDLNSKLDNFLKNNLKKLSAEEKKQAKEAQAIVKAQLKTVASIWDSGIAKGVERLVSGGKAAAKATLADFARAQDYLNEKIDVAKDRLAEMRKEYAQMAAQTASSLMDSFSLKDSFFAEDGGGVAGVTARMKSLASKAKSLAHKIKTLGAKGIPSALIQQIVGLGIEDGLIVASEFEKMDAKDVEDLSSAFGDLTNWTESAGKRLATEFYGVGIATQKGLVEGLLSDQKALATAAKKLSDALTNEVKKTLKIASPSKVLAEIGRFAGLGLANGVSSMERAVSGAMGGVVDKMVQAADVNPAVGLDLAYRVSGASAPEQDRVVPILLAILDVIRVIPNLPDALGDRIKNLTVTADFSGRDFRRAVKYA
jgi:phage-related protein